MKKRKKAKPLVIGLTGGFASGKSSVAGILRSYGAEVIDADRIYHFLLKPGSPLYRKIVSKFGRGLLTADKRIERRMLAKIVFSGNKLLRELNRITHPRISAVIKKRIRQAKGRVVVLDAALLLEAGLDKAVDKIVVVSLRRNKQIKRGMLSLGVSRKEALERISAQMPLQAKVRAADFIIDNNGTIANTKKQVSRIRRILWKSSI